MMNPPAKFMLKGRVGDFEYGKTAHGRGDWAIRDRRTGEWLGTATSLSGASRAASAFYVAENYGKEKK